MVKSDTSFLEAADRLGSRLCRDAIQFEGRCNWVGPSMEPVGQSWSVVRRAMGSDVYAGTTGIALFLAHLYDATREAAHRKVADAAVAQSRSQLDRVRQTGGFGVYAGLMGVAYAWLEIDAILGRGTLTDAATTLARDCATAEDLDGVGTDVVSGCAGLIPVLIDMNQRLGEPVLLDCAVRLGERLLRLAKHRDAGVSWHTVDVPAIDHLTGFSHGASGISWALFELHAATGDRRFLDVARGGFAYERACFDTEMGNWPDFRVLDGMPITPKRRPGFALAWCHGAPGIGLARRRAFELTGDDVYRHELAIAMRTTTESLRPPLPVANYSLCHGLLGNADLFIESAGTIGNAAMLEPASDLARAALLRHHEEDNPWPCGVPQAAAETPGLMLGLAGIGYFFLRMTDARKHRSVLILGPTARG